MANYAKWSDHADRLYIWDTETGDIQHILNESSWMRRTGISKQALKWAKAGSGTVMAGSILRSAFAIPNFIFCK